MNPLEPLESEHRLIRQALGAMASLIDAARLDRRISPEPFLEFEKLINKWIEGVHHSAEERLVFRELLHAGLPGDCGPLGRAEHEREVRREYAEAMGAAARACRAGERRRQAQMIEFALAYCHRLELQLVDEERVVHPMARRLLGEGVVEQRCDGFDAAVLRLVERAQLACRSRETSHVPTRPFFGAGLFEGVGRLLGYPS